MTVGTEKRIHLSSDRVDRLSQLALAHRMSEDQIIERALDILFSLTQDPDGPTEHRVWSSLSEGSLRRVWDNDEDARYDNRQELYGTPAR